MKNVVVEVRNLKDIIPNEAEIQKVTGHLASLILAPPKALEKYNKNAGYSLDNWVTNLSIVIHEALRLGYAPAFVVEQITHDVMNFWRLWFFGWQFTPRINSFAEELPKRKKRG